MHVLKIISGGQTGVDRAALDAAITNEVEHGGWCPKDRIAEDGRLRNKYQLQETDSSDYSIRTKLNVRDSDGTLILSTGRIEGGTALTVEYSRELNKPVLVIDPDNESANHEITDWIRKHGISTLNVAGPRESKQPGIYDKAYVFLDSLINNIKL